MPKKNSRTVTLKRVDPLSIAKIYAIGGAVLGLIIGLGVSIFSVSTGFVYGAVAIVVLPIVYGLVGFVASAIAAFLYNLIAERIGGIKIEFE